MSGTDQAGGRHVTLIREMIGADEQVSGHAQRDADGAREALSVLVGERDRYRAALEDIAAGRWNTGSASVQHGRVGYLSAREYAREALRGDK